MGTERAYITTLKKQIDFCINEFNKNKDISSQLNAILALGKFVGFAMAHDIQIGGEYIKKAEEIMNWRMKV